MVQTSLQPHSQIYSQNIGLPDTQPSVFSRTTYEEQALYAFSLLDTPNALEDEDFKACLVALDVFRPAPPPPVVQVLKQREVDSDSDAGLAPLVVKEEKNYGSPKEFVDKPGRIYKCPRAGCRKVSLIEWSFGAKRS
jgi:hypothetical protein